MTSSHPVAERQQLSSPRYVKALGLLERLGFSPQEIHYGTLLTDGRMSVPAVVGEEVGYFLVDTSQREDVVLELGRAIKWGLSYERTDDRWGQSTCPGIFALGRSRSEGTVAVVGTEASAEKLYTTCGTLGAAFFRDSVLALDPIDAAVGLSETLDLANGANDALGLPLQLGNNIPFTDALQDKRSRGAPLRLVIDTNRTRSVIMLDYVGRAWTKVSWRRRAQKAQRTGGRVGLSLRVPELGKDVSVDALVFERSSPPKNGAFTIDGFLGIDFLYRFLPVIDFRQRILWLAPLEL